MADVLNFPSPLAPIPTGSRADQLRVAHDGFRAVGDICRLAAIYEHKIPEAFLHDLYSILSREAIAAERASPDNPPHAA